MQDREFMKSREEEHEKLARQVLEIKEIIRLQAEQTLATNTEHASRDENAVLHRRSQKGGKGSYEKQRRGCTRSCQEKSWKPKK